MAELSIEQRKAIAIARARQRAQTNQPHANVPAYDPGIPGYNPQTGEVERQFSRGASAALGAADVATFGFGDEAMSYPLAWAVGKPREQVLAEIRDMQSGAQEQNPGSYLAGQVGAGVAQGVGLVGGGLSFGAHAVRSGAGLGRAAIGGAADGAILGGIHGAGSGEDGPSRAKAAAIGSTVGALAGGAAPYAVAGAQAAGRAVSAPLMARLRPESYANRAVGEGLRRSGMSADDVADTLARARADGQDVFTVADAMGHSGQRMLSTVTRNPNEMRQVVTDALVRRQTGQGERLSSYLAEGFNASDTAAQRTASLTGQRSALANVNYENARRGAGAVDVSGALRAADDILTPGVNRIANPGSQIADDSLEGVVRRARSLLTDGQSNLTDFSSVLRAKQDIDDMIGAAQRAGRNNQVRILSQINSSLDSALERASPAYRQANDAFRAQSRTIDAVETGRAAASSRTRAADSIQTFRGMQPGEQSAFRAGYVDPVIARVEASANSATTNRARPLLTDKTAQEFAAIAEPRRAAQMGRRIGREQQMFETANAALGGSKTADNLADAAEMTRFDPGVMMNLFRGRPVAAALDAIGRVANEAQGMSPRVIEQIASVLIETNPQAARQLLTQGARNAAQNDVRRAIAAIMIGNAGGATGGRMGAGRQPLQIDVSPR